MTREKRLLAVVLGAAALIAPVAAVSANHVRFDGVPAPVGPSVVAPPAGVIVPAPAPTRTLHADEIEAGVVRANIVYANKLEADEVRGVVHQTRGLKVKDSEGKIKAPEVVASVIYADEISANAVVADAIYVRELTRH
jgi:hypothetical protein